jgi:hypothetical protein
MNKHPLGLAEGATENAATDRHREKSQIPQSRDPTVCKDVPNSLHLSRRERILFAQLQGLCSRPAIWLPAFS